MAARELTPISRRTTTTTPAEATDPRAGSPRRGDAHRRVKRSDRVRRAPRYIVRRSTATSTAAIGHLAHSVAAAPRRGHCSPSMTCGGLLSINARSLRASRRREEASIPNRICRDPIGTVERRLIRRSPFLWTVRTDFRVRRAHLDRGIGTAASRGVRTQLTRGGLRCLAVATPPPPRRDWGYARPRHHGPTLTATGGCS